MSTNNLNPLTVADRFQDFNQRLIAFVEQCPADKWRQVTKAEGWPVGVTAHHVGAIHYPVLAWVQMMVEGTPTPAITMTDVDEMNRQHVVVQADCRPTEVVQLLQQEGDKVVAYLQTLNETALHREAYLKIFDTTMSAGQLFQAVLIDSAEEHLTSLQVTVRG
ncbi:MAG: DinB family protein [Caldilinea sp. CFX5]|nr:DinB family protein [Caldilinea sp. CFX5]